MINRIVITGCTQGLGRALAIKFAKEDCHVFGIGRNSQQLESLASHSTRITPIKADITTQDGRKEICNALGNEPLSIIHNAATLEPKLFIHLTEDILRLQFETNYFAPLLLTQQLLPFLKEQRVLHISSGAADMALPGLLPYCGSKRALEHATACLNAEFSTQQIYFANLRPGLIDTSMQSHLRNASEEDMPHRQFYIDAKNQNLLRSPKEVAEFVSWVMLKTDNDLFTRTLWDISNHHNYKSNLS